MKYEKSKKLQAEQILKYLQKFVKDNSIELKMNNDEANRIMKKKGTDPNKLEELNWLNARNKMLVQKNNQFLELHARLLDFLKSLPNFKDGITELAEKQHKTVDEEPKMHEYFALTIENKIDFNSRHPFYNNVQFKKLLMEYYIDREEYEICEKIVKSA